VRVMGILNLTPDSFSDGGQFDTREKAVAAGRRMFDEGAWVVDVGGESTRPGACSVPLTEERARVLPVIRELSRYGDVSIDTTKPDVARDAIAAGARIINDTSGCLYPLAGKLAVGYVGMHRRGAPATMQDNPHYDDVVGEVFAALDRIARNAHGYGVNDLWIDPGIGFGKNIDHNVALLRELPKLCQRGVPVLLGVSRKTVIGALTGRTDPGDRLGGSLAAAAAAWAAGVEVIRTHDVAETIDLITVLKAVTSPGVAKIVPPSELTVSLCQPRVEALAP